jgi:hypothetical protein
VADSISIPRFTTVWDHQCHPSFNIKNKPRTTFLTLIYYHACQPTAFSNWAWFLYLSESMLLMIHHGKYKMAEWWLFKPWRVGEIYAEQHQYHATETFLVVNKNKMFATTLKLPSMAYQTQKANRLQICSTEEKPVFQVCRGPGFYAVLKSTLLFVEFIYFKQ